VEGKKFQMQTDQEITTSENIRWTLGGVNWLKFMPGYIYVPNCDKYDLKGTEGFLQRAGVLTFLKTTTQLQVWFDDVLEVTWVYVDDGCRTIERWTVERRTVER